MLARQDATMNTNRMAINTTFRSDTAEQYKHCTVRRFLKLNHCAKLRMDIMRVMAPRTSPLLTATALVSGLCDCELTAAEKK